MLEIKLKGEILQNEKHSWAGGNYSPCYHLFSEIGICANLENGLVQLSVPMTEVSTFMNFKIVNAKLIPYIESIQFDCTLPDGIERLVGRYKLGTAKGRISQQGDSAYHVYIGGENLDDMKAFLQKIEDGEIWPVKIPQKEHIPAYKLYRKTYGVPAMLAIIAGLLSWLTIVVMKEETYLWHVQYHNTAGILMVQCMWGIVVACLSGSYWSYLFAKDIKPMRRITLGILVFAGLLWFIGCFYYMIFTS